MNPLVAHITVYGHGKRWWWFLEENGFVLAGSPHGTTYKTSLAAASAAEKARAAMAAADREIRREP